MSYVYLVLAIMCELCGTSLLKAAQGFSKPLFGVLSLVVFCLSLVFLSLSLRTLPLSMTYAIWSGLGTVATVMISILVWKEKVTVGSVVGISFIIIGVVILNLFAPVHADSDQQPVQENQENV